MELLKNLEGLSADEQMSAVVELQKAAMKHLEEQKQASIGKSAEMVILGLKKIKSDFEAKFDSLNYDIQTKVANLKDGQQGLQGPKGEQGDRGLDGYQGKDGRDGKDGKDGTDGQDGVSVTDAKIDFDGSLVITLSDGREINVGEVVPVDVAQTIHKIQSGSGGDSQTVLDAIAALQATIATYGTMATQNANNVAITGGTINNTTIGATTPSTGVFTTLTATGQTSLGGVAGAESLIVNAIAGSTRWIEIAGSVSGNTSIRTRGAGNPSFQFVNRGTGPITFSTADSLSNEQFRVSNTASAVNYVQVTGAATGGIPRISAQGSDSAASLAVTAKSGTIWLETASGFGMVGVNHTAGANNYLALTGGANNPPVISAASGFNSNVPLLLQSKGTGAIDLAAGSSGVNISNGGTVTALTTTANGTAYTSLPSVAISAPTTAGGVQATASISAMFTSTATVNSGGTGYTIGDVLTLGGGTVSGGGAVGRYTVASVSSGVITAVTRTQGNYLVLPTNPVSVTGGTGTDATLNLTWLFQSASITNAGSGYVEQPTVTFSGGGGSGAAAYATVGSGTLVQSIGSTMSFRTPSGEALRLFDAGGTGVNYLGVQGRTAGNGPLITAQGSDTNIFLGVSSKGTSQIGFYTNNVAQEQMRVAHTASAVNYHQLTGSATGSGPIHSVAGSDTNIDLNLTSKGTGGVRFNVGNGVKYTYLSSDAANNTQLIGAVGGNLGIYATSAGSIRFYTTTGLVEEQFRISQTVSAVNYVQVTGAATGGTPTISAQGSDSNIGPVIASKGVASVILMTNSQRQFDVYGPASAVNYIRVSGAVASSSPALSAQGSDTNIPLVLQPKGTGALQAQQTDSTATGGNARGANAVDFQTSRGAASNVASGGNSFIGSGNGNTVTSSLSSCVSGNANSVSGYSSFIGAGNSNIASNVYSSVTTGVSNTASNFYTTVVNGNTNTAAGYYNFIGNGQSNSGTSGSAITTQSATMNGTTAVTLSGSNASIKVGQYITGTSIGADTYVAAISGTSLTLSKVASGSSTSTLSFYTPHGVVVGGGNNQATGSYSFIGGGGDAGTAANRNVASGDWSVVGGGVQNVASGSGSVVVGGGYVGSILGNTASGVASAVLGGISNNASALYATILGGRTHTGNGNYSTIVGAGWGNTRGLTGYTVFPASSAPITGTAGVSQAAMLVLGKQTTDATATVITSDGGAAGTTNQVILPNNSAYYFKGSVIANVTGGGNTKAWAIEGAIKRGANAASTALVGTPTVTSGYADAGASTWDITATADTTNGGLKITFTGQAGTTIRVVAKLETTEVTF